MPSNLNQEKLASLIISIIILIIVIILIIIVCCNYNINQPIVQNQQVLAAAAMYGQNQGKNINAAANVVRNNPQVAALGAYAYKNNFARGPSCPPQLLVV
jgi:hypothetical protein